MAALIKAKPKPRRKAEHFHWLNRYCRRIYVQRTKNFVYVQLAEGEDVILDAALPLLLGEYSKGKPSERVIGRLKADILTEVGQLAELFQNEIIQAWVGDQLPEESDD